MNRFPTSFSKRRLASIVLALIGPALVLGLGQSSPDTKTILEGVAKAYGNQRQYDVTVSTTTEEHSPSGKGVLRARLRIASEDQDKFRLEQESSVEIDGVPNNAPFGQMVIIGDGTDVWGISPALNQYTKHRPSDLPTIQAWVKAAKSAVFDPPAVLEKGVNSTLLREESLAIGGVNLDCFVIKLISADRPESTTFWVEKARFVIRRTHSEVSGAGTQGIDLSTTTEFPSVNIGAPAPAGTFVFTPSLSATEVDKVKP